MSSKNNTSLVGIILILLLLGLNAYQWVSGSKVKTTLKNQQTQYQELEKVNTELDFNYQAKLQELEGLRGDNQELNAKIQTQVDALAKQKRKISGLIWTEKELGKAREAMSNLNTQADQYIAEITQLKKENADLSTRNASLSTSNETLTQEVAVNKKRISNLDSAKTVLMSEREELSGTNEVLSTQVDMAEAIKINFLEVKGYDVKDGGEVSHKKRAKKVEMLRTCFKTETNMVTKAGAKDFYVTFTAPSGEILYVEDLGSGTLKNKLTGETEKYTISGTVDYENDDLNACLDWRPNFKLVSGLYQVDMYNNGFLVGKGEFKLK